MKKLSIVVLALALVGSVLSSCKSHEKCPAYGKVSQTESAVNS
ncbi:MAG TPA: hypothetical protein VFF35_11580 [Bacteroidia bacterium]|nr:hypothetical protein [Bacteroidia bacterium]